MCIISKYFTFKPSGLLKYIDGKFIDWRKKSNAILRQTVKPDNWIILLRVAIIFLIDGFVTESITLVILFEVPGQSLKIFVNTSFITSSSSLSKKLIFLKKLIN